MTEDPPYWGTPVWEFDQKLKGYRGRMLTPEEDFSQPYVDPDDYDII